MNRRQFLSSCVAGMGVLASAGCGSPAPVIPPSETIHIGCIGTGKRCIQLLNFLNEMPGLTITAVCDVWDENLAMGRAHADASAFATKHSEELLARSDVDAVIISTPDHWHAAHTIEACHAGKDVYVEKPLTHNLAEGAAIIQAQRETGRVVQVGMQQRSMPHLMEAKDIAQSGDLGEVIKVRLTWNRNFDRAPDRDIDVDPATVDWQRFLGNAPDQPFDPYRFRHWRWFWDFGGGMFSDLMVHLIDVAYWYLDLQPPASARSIGSFVNREGMWETPDTVQTLLEYRDPNTQIHFEGTFSNARNAAMIEFMGTDATLYCDRGRYEFHPEPNRDAKYRERVDGIGARGRSFYGKPNGEVLHLNNWIECIRSRKEPNATVSAGVQSAAAAHLANIALRENRVAKWSEET